MILSCTQGPMKHDSSTVATSRARARLPCWAHEPSNGRCVCRVTCVCVVPPSPCVQLWCRVHSHG